MLPLTTKQAEFVGLIRKLTKDGVPPSYQELADASGLAGPPAVNRMLRALKERGHVTFEHGRARTIRVIEPDLPSLEGLTKTQLIRLRERIDAALAARFAEAA
jgi:SOS-response transcriptional repressor LexA